MHVCVRCLLGMHASLCLCVCWSALVGFTQGTTKQHLVAHEKLETRWEACVCVCVCVCGVLSPSFFLSPLSTPYPNILTNK